MSEPNPETALQVPLGDEQGESGEGSAVPTGDAVASSPPSLGTAFPPPSGDDIEWVKSNPLRAADRINRLEADLAETLAILRDVRAAGLLVNHTNDTGLQRTAKRRAQEATRG